MNLIRDRRGSALISGIAVVAAIILPQTARAAWLGYRNNTTAPVVIQSAIVVNNQLRWGKPHTLFPGEVAWDAAPAPGTRIIGVFDPKRNNRLVYQDSVNVTTTDIFLSLQMIVPPAPRGMPAQPAVPRLIAIKVPISPPGGATPTPVNPNQPNIPRITPPSTTPPKAPGMPPPKAPGNPPAGKTNG